MQQRKMQRRKHQFNMVKPSGFVFGFERGSGNQGVPMIKKTEKRRLIGEKYRSQFNIAAPFELVKKISNHSIVRIKRASLDPLNLPITHFGVHLAKTVTTKRNLFPKKPAPVISPHRVETNLTKRCCRIGFLG